MGLLQSLISGLVSGQEGTASPIQGVLMNMLSGQGGTGQANVGAGAGLSGLISAFEQAGLGHLAQSWVGNGPNQSVSPQQLQSVFGEQQVQGMASQAGMTSNDFLSELSQHLPAVVSGMTPNGRIPDAGTVSV